MKKKIMIQVTAQDFKVELQGECTLKISLALKWLGIGTPLFAELEHEDSSLAGHGHSWRLWTDPQNDY